MAPSRLRLCVVRPSVADFLSAESRAAPPDDVWVFSADVEKLLLLQCLAAVGSRLYGLDVLAVLLEARRACRAASPGVSCHSLLIQPCANRKEFYV